MTKQTENDWRTHLRVIWLLFLEKEKKPPRQCLRNTKASLTKQRERLTIWSKMGTGLTSCFAHYTPRQVLKPKLVFPSNSSKTCLALLITHNTTEMRNIFKCPSMKFQNILDFSSKRTSMISCLHFTLISNDMREKESKKYSETPKMDSLLWMCGKDFYFHFSTSKD